MKSVLVPIAKGFEEIELVSVVDILRRAEVRVALASLDSHKRVLGAHHIIIEADCSLPEQEINDFDAIVLAGGYGGMQALCANELVSTWLQAFAKDSKIIAAICAAPIVLDKAGVLKGNFVCYPGCENEIDMNNKVRVNSAVVTNGSLITSAAPATAMLFALTLVHELCGKEKAEKLYNELQMPILQTYFTH